MGVLHRAHGPVPDRAHDGRFRAVCDCGWKSEGYFSAGMAGAEWDRHRQDDHPEDVRIYDET